MKLQCEALFILDAQNLYAKLQKQNAKEILMLYTCYNPEKVEHTPYRFVIYAKKI